MKKYFYTHLIEVDSVYTVLDLLDMKTHEREDLMIIIESTIHHVVMDTVMSNLSDEDKKVFLTHVAKDYHDGVWHLLSTKARNVEKKIIKAVDKVKKEFHTDIKKTLRK